MHSRCLFDQATPMVCVWSHMMHPTEFLWLYGSCLSSALALLWQMLLRWTARNACLLLFWYASYCWKLQNFVTCASSAGLTPPTNMDIATSLTVVIYCCASFAEGWASSLPCLLNSFVLTGTHNQNLVAPLMNRHSQVSKLELLAPALCVCTQTVIACWGSWSTVEPQRCSWKSFYNHRIVIKSGISSLEICFSNKFSWVYHCMSNFDASMSVGAWLPYTAAHTQSIKFEKHSA